MKKLSLKLRIIISLLISSFIIWVAVGIISWIEIKDEIDEFFDTYQALLAKQLAVADWNNVTPQIQLKTDQNINSFIDIDDDSLSFAIFDRDGKMIFSDGQDGNLFVMGNEVGFVNQTVDNDRWRIFWLDSYDNNYKVAVGQEMEFREEAALSIIAQFFIPWVASLFILIIIFVFLLTKEFRPLKKMAKEIQARKPNNFTPIDTNNIPPEVAPLVESVNNLLKRIDLMITRERAFISDAAHELKTPLTALKVQMEVAIISGDDEKMREKAFKNIEKGIERSARLVEQMLALSRVESNNNMDLDEILDWKSILKETIKEQNTLATQKEININCHYLEKPFIERGNNTFIMLLLRNILDNAIRYSPNGASITIDLNHNYLTVFNSGVTVSQDTINRLGERFFRPPGQEQSGSGLGLSIVKRIADINKCNIIFLTTKDGFMVELTNRKD